MDADLNTYDVEHACTAHAKMSKAEWEGIYREAWSLYYTPEHMETLLRRAAVTGVKLSSLAKLLVQFKTTVRVEKLHPLQAGILRLKHPSERRPGLPAISAWAFWPRFIGETLYKQGAAIGAIVRMVRLVRAVQRDPNALDYTDRALSPVRDDEDEALDLMTLTGGAREAVAHIKRVDQLTHARGAA